MHKLAFLGVKLGMIKLPESGYFFHFSSNTVRQCDSGYVKRMETVPQPRPIQIESFVQHKVSGDGQTKKLKLDWNFYLQPSCLENSLPIHPACPESPRLTVCLKLTFTPIFIKIKWKIPKLSFWDGKLGVEEGWLNNPNQDFSSFFLKSFVSEQK